MVPESCLTAESDLESVISAQERLPKRRRTSTGPKYFCSVENCEAVFNRLDHLDRHEYKHTGIKKHSCTYEGCNKTYSIVTHLKRHLRCTHERKEPPMKTIRCDVESCLKMFQNVSNMQRHIREVHENPKIYHCSYCGEKFTQRLKMRRHEVLKHTKKYPFNCSKCSKGFYQEWQYERHVSSCKTYPCGDCNLQFDKWSMYIKHCKKSQHGPKYYKCEQCSRTYGKPGQLQEHIAAKHMEKELQLVFTCQYKDCARSYAYERNLKQHQRTAHFGKRFPCSAAKCSLVFSSAQNLKKHVERDHETTVTRDVRKSTVGLKQRRKRKDAGQTLSNLAKLSGLAVNKNLDKLLREREETALEEVTATLGEMQDVEEKCIQDGNGEGEETALKNNDKRGNQGGNTAEITPDTTNSVTHIGNWTNKTSAAD